MALVSDMNWSVGVYMELGKLGQFRVVCSTREAADILLNRWPTEGGDAYFDAQLVCYEVMQGKRPPDEARHAFIVAAEEAGLFITGDVPKNLTLVLPEPAARPKKRGHRIYRP